MNWIKKVFTISDKIKKILKKRPTKEDIENSKWISCCGPILPRCFVVLFKLFKFVDSLNEVH